MAATCAEAYTWAINEHEIAVDDAVEELAADIDMSPLALLELRPIRLYVIPVEGTPLTGVSDFDPTAITSTAKLPPKIVVDHEIERRRMRLNRYFKRLNASFSDFDVHTYDPWQYPNT